MSLCPACGGTFCDTPGEHPPSSDKVRLVSSEARKTNQFWKKNSALFNKEELQHGWSEAGMSSMTCCGLSCRDATFCGRQQCPEPISWRWETNTTSQLLAVCEGGNLSCLIPVVKCSASTQLQWEKPSIFYPCNKNEWSALIFGDKRVHACLNI